MQKVNLTKGQELNLSKEANLRTATVGLGWSGKNGRSVDLDSFVALRTENDNNISFIYFGNKRYTGVKHNGDDLVGGGSANYPNETIDIDFSELPNNVRKVVVGLFIYSGASNLSGIKNGFINVADSSGELIRYKLESEFAGNRSVIAGEFIRTESNEWIFKAAGKGLTMSYNEIRAMFTSNTRQTIPNGSYNNQRRGGIIEDLCEAICDIFD